MGEGVAYLLGLATLPALTGIGFLYIKLIMHDAVRETACGVCDYKIARERPIVRWIKWFWHDVTRGWLPWHRAALDEYQRKWRIGKHSG